MAMETYFLKPDNQKSSLPPLTYDQRRPLQLLGIFRIFISSTFCLLYITGNLITPLGSYNPDAFFSTSLFYLALGVAIWLSIRAPQILFELKVWISALTDIILLTMLMHFSGGIQSGLGVLLVVTLATSSVLLGGRKALGLAAIATLIILVEQFYIGLSYPRGRSYPFAGLLGTTYFASAILFMYVARRVRESEALATRRGIDLANLAQLTQHIIQRMQTGILVLDSRGHIRLLNESAAQMLRIDEQHHNSSIQDVAPELAEQWQAWIKNPEKNAEAIQLKNNPIDISPRFSRIGDDKDAGAVVFLQDMAAMAQQAQQLQLASLGRLSASIAHEIRNPLGAISHAGQLLAESENLDNNDVRLTQIISDHSRRLNTIVENVMSVSRRNPSQVELFNLKEYVEQYVQDYTVGHGLDNKTIDIDIKPANTMVRFDVGHLHQILNNLFQNALHHSRDISDNPRVTILGGRSHGEARPFLDVYDKGPGISDELQEQIFEPFFTTETTGTGLGLYLSRELAEGNQAHLNYIKDNDGKGCFRITFQDPRRQID
jgi:two-component system sensor histidine kinase PilS (NtrC family)